ncbi:hypothetical protein [Alteromonas hispanica]|uniref:Uncharacterized protein n=1 Tax=Alteromonas hispanica TaxID=315421 RepID=A0A6L9MYV9_9ALTE|nr:hypothetical protein [Alteromonas hispanica]NDW23205.1 hypothetical protein [Alteromonas hispanica]
MNSETLTIAVWALAIFLFIAQSLEHYQIYIKSSLSIKGTIAKGYNSAMKIMVVNRLFIVSYYFIFGFLIDYGVAFREFVVPLIFSLFFLCIANLLMARRYRSTAIIDASERVGNVWNTLSISNAVATYFNLLGIIIPLLIASILPEYRLTLSNSSFLFNTAFVLINVFVIESRLAKLYDTRGDVVGATYSIMVVRTLSSVCAILTVGTLYVFIVF